MGEGSKVGYERWRSLTDAETLRQFVRKLGEGIYVTSHDGEIIDANPAFLSILGVETLEQLRGLRAQDLLVDPEVRSKALEILAAEGEVREYELELRAPDGSRRTVLDTAYRVTDEDTGEVFYHGILVDITARKQLERRLADAAVRDQLTGCYNRHYLAQLAERLEAGDARWGVVVLDADHFKTLNDTQGHLAGDRALVRLGRFLCSEVRIDDVVVRFGGDEFLVVVVRDPQEAVPGLVERLRGRSGGLGFSFSLGWAVREGNEALERTINRADAMLIETRRRERAGTGPPGSASS